MTKIFNVNGACKPNFHYMVDITTRLEAIKMMIDKGQYFTINRARQYGKTTTLRLLANFLKDDYEVISLDFQRISFLAFESEQSFVATFSEELLDCVTNFPEGVEERLTAFMERTARINSLHALFKTLKLWCQMSEKKIVLIIDEVDTATNNQVFCDFLSQLRAAYLDSDVRPTFQSVILAGVYDVRNMRRKIRLDENHKENSPWNIATDFEIDMCFSVKDIEGMLTEYKEDYQIKMNIMQMSTFIYEYTFGYPYLVSKLCKLLDEKIAGSLEFPTKSSAWTKEGFLETQKILVKENNTLYQSLIGKLNQYKELKTVIYELLFTGKPIPYISTSNYIQVATMFGFVRNENDMVVIFNRIFETVLYNYFISEEFITSKMYRIAVQEKNQFIVNGHLDMKKILEKFVETFHYLYGDKNETFLEDVGRKYFILFLKPIINGIGNYSIEPETRNSERMDLVVYYRGEQFVCELKI